MRWYTTNGEQRIWFEPDEIEAIAEDELRKAGLLPSVDQPVIELERFVEAHLQAPLDQYADLPADVLGVTEFRSGQRPAIVINRDLTGAALDDEEAAPGVHGRWRATVAHEAAHVLLHRMLFESDLNQGSLFPDATVAERGALMRCLKRDVGHARTPSDWREVQANRGMAALLMPRKVFSRVVRAELVSLGISRGVLEKGGPHATRLVGRLARRFEVSRQAASIRLGTLGFVSSSPTLNLPPDITP